MQMGMATSTPEAQPTVPSAAAENPTTPPVPSADNGGWHHCDCHNCKVRAKGKRKFSQMDAESTSDNNTDIQQPVQKDTKLDGIFPFIFKF